VSLVASSRPPSVQWTAIATVTMVAAIFSISVFLIGFETLASNLRKLAPGISVVCFVLLVWQLGCRFLRWLYYARCLGLKLPVGQAALYYAAGLGMTLTPGRLGEAVRLWFLERRLAVPYRRIAGLYVADRVSDAAAYVILFAVGSASYSGRSPVAWGGLLTVAALTLMIMYPRPIVALLTGVYAIVGRGRTQVLWLRRAVRNTSILFQPRVFIPGLAVGALGWLAPPAVLTISLMQMDVGLDPLRAVAIYAASALAGGATMLPGGGGGTEAVLVGLLVAANVPLDAAISAMIVTRLVFLWVPVGIGFCLLPIAIKSVRGVERA
jgi:glycosyltransferase 2 family protein